MQACGLVVCSATAQHCSEQQQTQQLMGRTCPGECTRRGPVPGSQTLEREGVQLPNSASRHGHRLPPAQDSSTLPGTGMPHKRCSCLLFGNGRCRAGSLSARMPVPNNLLCSHPL